MKQTYKCAESVFFLLLVAFSLPLSMVAQAPNISYSGVATAYPVNVAITALTPTNTGGAVSGLTNNVTTFAGSGTQGQADGTGTSASFYSPLGVAIDASGNVYVAERNNHKIRKITSAGVVTTFAGSGTAGSTNATGTSASFQSPHGLAVDASGNIYVADYDNHKIRKITPAGVVTTFAGSGTAGSTDATGISASFNNPIGVAVDASGNVYVADYSNHKIRKITPAGVVTTLAGSGTAGSTDATGTSASFYLPMGVAVDASGNVYVGDLLNNKIRKITSAGVVTTFAGSGAQGSTDGTGTSASFKNPGYITRDASGNFYVADNSNYKIRKITSAGVVTTLAGSGTQGSTDAIGTSASFKGLGGVAVISGNLYVADNTNYKIRKIDLYGYSISPDLPAGLSINASGVISGTPTATAPSTTYTITATNANGSSSTTITFSVEVPPNISYSGVAATYPRNVAITALTPTNSGSVVLGLANNLTVLAGSGLPVSTDGTGASASFYSPSGVAVDASSNVYVADWKNNKIRKITPAGVVTTFAGSGSAGSTDATGTSASFNGPYGIAVDASGNVYVADNANHKIRKITSAGVVTTFAGSGSAGSTDATGTSASFYYPVDVAVDALGNVYVADGNNHKIRKITSAGVVSTLAGSGTTGSTDATSTSASFNTPYSVAVDASGNVYVADLANQKIRKITSAGVVTTLAGSGTASSTDGTGTSASFNNPYGVAVDASGNVYVADFSTSQIRKITSAGVVTTLALSAQTGVLNNPRGVAVDASGNLYVADYGNNKIRKVALYGYSVSPALPAGLSINASGVISGTPTATAASTTYTITGTNAVGSSSTTMNFSTFTSYKWTGGTTAWATASNWESITAPTSTSDIVIPNTTNKPTLSTNTMVASVTFTGNNQLILGNFNLTTNSLTGGSSTAYVVTDGTGSLTINNIGTTATLFPVGPSTTAYAPVTITNNVSRNFTVKVGTTLTNPVANYRYVNQQWDITPSVLTGNTATLAFGWSSSAQAASFNPAESVQVNHYNTTSNTWDASFSATVSGSNPYTATASGITTFSPFNVSNVTVLPVELLSFSGKNIEVRNPATGGTEGGNLLTWQTAEEKNVLHFDIERSTNGQSFTKIGTVKAQGSHSDYQFTDPQTTANIHYYRLKIYDFDGKTDYSKVITLSNSSKSRLIIYPSVTQQFLTIETNTESADYQVFNLLGQQVLTGKTNPQRLDVSALPNGTYMVRVGQEAVKFIKQ
ncbi:MAG: putative Ig domain-containing protein [Saprospiraceae bacterium]|nr:putative Ig domain-containing protein [Saprospiraceae bacterium]